MFRRCTFGIEDWSDDLCAVHIKGKVVVMGPPKPLHEKQLVKVSGEINKNEK